MTGWARAARPNAGTNAEAAAPRFEATFDQDTALAFATDLARNYPNRLPGTQGADKATEWMTKRFSDDELAARGLPADQAVFH